MRLLTTAANASEAELVCGRLRAAGIEAIAQGGASAARALVLGSRDVYVDEKDFDRARDVLDGSEGISEAELVEAEEEDASARAARQGAQSGEAEGAEARPSGRRRFWRRP